ncbi:MAG TPA: elongation factor G, partial [Tepidisphaeraceae bacterium]|nr:elongation factor G [Tepidisphaeraceae bacterium]
TTVKWEGYKDQFDQHTLNLIDTPGHVDFTIEVERSLRVLDGAVLVLCSVAGVQSQSMTVDRQMKRYHVPRLAFINKMDRTGANAFKGLKDLREKLGADAFLMQFPMGAGATFEGCVDLVTMKAYWFDGAKGEKVREGEIPEQYAEEAKHYRHEMLEAISMYSDEVMEKVLSEEDVPEDLIHKVVKQAVQQQGATPVYLGTALGNKGVQLLLDAIIRYLPSPLERDYKAKQWANPDETFKLEPDPAKPFVGMAFKIVEDPFGQLTFTRIYQGKIEKGGTYVNQRTGKSDRFSRIVKMHADKREEVDCAEAGDIVAVMGIDCASGDTYAANAKYCTLESMFVPEPVIKMAVTAANRADADKMGKALQRFRKEDPTFRVFNDEETNEILIAGMGELHLDIYIERIRREYKVELEVSPPQVSYRECATIKHEYNYKHKKQTGGSGQYAHIVGYFEPIAETDEGDKDFQFIDEVVGGRIPKNFIPSVEKGFKDSVHKGPLAEYPVVGIKCVLQDGSYHDVDSSDRAFQIAARDCFRETFKLCKPVLLEPIMKLEIEVPEDFQGPVVGDVTSRRGIIQSTDMKDRTCTIVAEVPLAETFGYATDLRSMTQGKGTFTMEVAGYKRVPASIQQDIIDEKKKQLVGAK